MYKMKQIWRETACNFLQWRRNPRVIMTFVLAFVLCLLLTDKAVAFADQYGTTMQIAEAFVWTFGDANSIMITSLLLVLLFADMPSLNASTPYQLVRTSRSVWLWAQVLYVALSTLLFMTFILAVTAIICAPISFVGNMWSETGAMLGYSGIGDAVALPASVKTMEMSLPYQCAIAIFFLMTLYMLLAACIMLAVNLRRGQFWGVLSVFLFSLFGLFLNPQIISQIFKLPEALFYKANVAVGWLSPLNHATYHMHNFGYDYLPRLWMTYVIFGALIALCVALGRSGMRRYSFLFSGTDE